MKEASKDKKESEDVDVEDLVKRCMTSVRKAITLEPKGHKHWNLLGLIAMEKSPPDFPLAQHSFIRYRVR